MSGSAHQGLQVGGIDYPRLQRIWRRLLPLLLIVSLLLVLLVKVLDVRNRRRPRVEGEMNQQDQDPRADDDRSSAKMTLEILNRAKERRVGHPASVLVGKPGGHGDPNERDRPVQDLAEEVFVVGSCNANDREGDAYEAKRGGDVDPWVQWLKRVCHA